jgi:hypothetical protein
MTTAPSAYGLKGPSAAITVDNATPQGATYLRGNTVQTNGTSSSNPVIHTDHDTVLRGVGHATCPLARCRKMRMALTGSIT